MTRKERIDRVLKYHDSIEKAWEQARRDDVEIDFIRHMVTTDVYFLLYYVLGRTDLCYEEWYELETLDIDGVKVPKGEGDVLVYENGKVVQDKKKGRKWRYYRPFLFERCEEIQKEPDGYLDIWARDHYKDLADDTPVWTLGGWKTQGTLEVGDYVMTPNGPSKVVAVRHFTDSHCKKINLRSGVSIVCGNGHLWKVNQWSSKRVNGNEREGWKENIVETNDIIKGYRHPYITVPEAYEGKDIPLPLDPYVLGVWLGDGDSKSGRITNCDDEVWEEIEKRGYKLSDNHIHNDRIHCKDGRTLRTRTIYGIHEDLSHLGVFGNKHIPTIYYCASKKDRLELLRGLIDTDGTVSKEKGDNGVTFCQKKGSRLVQDIITLLASLGYKARVCEQKLGTYVSFVAKPTDKLFYVKSKQMNIKNLVPQKQSSNWYIQSIEEHETVPTTCIQIEDPDGMYYVSKHFVQTHNSTIITYGMTIQEILKNPEITICIYSYNISTAQKMLVQIRTALQHPILVNCFPEILFENTNVQTWKDEEGGTHQMEWSSDGFTVKRKGNPKEHTLECSGLVTGQKTGGHYNLLIYDDTVTPESVATKAQIDKTTSQFEMSLNTGSTANLRIRMIGTRYALHDTYEKVIKNGTVRLRLYSCVDEEGHARLYSEPVLKWKLSRMHGSVVATQMYCDPQAVGSFNFDLNWLPVRIPRKDIVLDNYNWYILCDPAWKISADADNTVFAVIGVTGFGSDRHFLVADLIADKLTLERKQEELFKLVNEFTNSRRKPIVFYERVSMQSDIDHYQTIMNSTGFSFTIIEASGKPKINYGMASTSSNMRFKDLRISVLQPAFKAGMFSFVDKAVHTNWRGDNEDMIETFFEEEYTKYPNSEHDDVLDVLSRCLDLDVGVQMTGPDKPVLKKKERKHFEIDYFSDDIYQPY